MNKITNTITTSLVAIACMLGLVGVVSVPAFAAPGDPPADAAIDPSDAIQGGVTGAGGGAGGEGAFKGGLKTIVNVLLFLLGAIAVIMIVIGGIRYTISNGDQGQIKQAKDTILYSVIGLIVALLAAAIVNFVLGQF